MSNFNSINVTNVFDIDPLAIKDDYERKAVLAMRTTALTVNGSAEATEANNELIVASSELGVAPTMTYEDLIFRNPLEREVYVMSSSSGQAQDEATFYVAHKEIESHLGDTISALTSDKPSESLECMDSAVKRLVALHRQLGAEAFAGFRPFFVGLNGYAGPSGLFSAAIPTVDILAHNGANMNQEERTRMLADVEAGLYPSHQSYMLRQLLTNGTEIKLGSTVVNGLVKRLNTFRRAHRGSVKKFVPQALESQAAGSGGVADVAGYLASKMVNIEGAKA